MDSSHTINAKSVVVIVSITFLRNLYKSMLPVSLTVFSDAISRDSLSLCTSILPQAEGGSSYQLN